MHTFIKLVLISTIFIGLNGLPVKKNNDTKRHGHRPEENTDLFEGDMRFPSASSLSKFKGRGVLLRGDTVAWPGGIVPYEIASGYSDATQQFLVNTMANMSQILAVNNAPCIQFRPRVPSDRYYIILVNGVGCSSYIGQNTEITMNRTVTLQDPDCITEGHIYHELIHALGFVHEQSRPDRDSYIFVNYTNIVSGYEGNFNKYDNTQVDTQNTVYDYASVMHYDGYAFSSNGYPTIVPLQANVQIGQRYNMSTLDIYKIQTFYNCSAATKSLVVGTTKKPTRKYHASTVPPSRLLGLDSAASTRFSWSLVIFLFLSEILFVRFC